MQASILRSPAGTSILEVKPGKLSGYWQAVVTDFNGGQPVTYTQGSGLNGGEASNMRARLIHSGWTELYRGEAK